MWDKAALEVVGSVTVWETTHLVYYNVQRCDVTKKMHLYKYGKNGPSVCWGCCAKLPQECDVM